MESRVLYPVILASLLALACHEETSDRRRASTAASNNTRQPNAQNAEASLPTGTGTSSSTNTAANQVEQFLAQLPVMASLATAMVNEKVADGALKTLILAGIDFVKTNGKTILVGQDQDKVTNDLISMLTQNGVSLDDTKKSNLRKGIADGYQALQASRTRGELNVGQMAGVLKAIVEGAQGKPISDPLLQLLLDPTILGALADRLASGDQSLDEISKALDDLVASRQPTAP